MSLPHLDSLYPSFRSLWKNSREEVWVFPFNLPILELKKASSLDCLLVEDYLNSFMVNFCSVLLFGSVLV